MTSGKSSNKILAKAHKILTITLQRKKRQKRSKQFHKAQDSHKFHLPSVITILSVIIVFMVRRVTSAMNITMLLLAFLLSDLANQDKSVVPIDDEAVAYIAEIFAPQYQFLISNMRIEKNHGSMNLIFDRFTLSDKQNGDQVLLLDDVDARFYIEDFLQLEIFPRYLHAKRLNIDLLNASNVEAGQKSNAGIEKYTQDNVLVNLLKQFHNPSALMSDEKPVESGYYIDNISLHVLGTNNRKIDINEGLLTFSQGTPDIDLSINSRISISNIDKGIHIKNLPISFGIVWHRFKPKQAADTASDARLITAYVATAPASLNEKYFTFPEEINQYGQNAAILRKKLLSPGVLSVQMTEKDGLYHSDLQFNWIGGFDFNITHPHIDSLITGKNLNISGNLNKLNLLSFYVPLNFIFKQSYWTNISINGHMLMRSNSKGKIDVLDMQFDGEDGALKLPFFPTVFDMTQWSVNLQYVKQLLSNNYYQFDYREPTRNIAISNQLVSYQNDLGETIFQLDYQLAPMFFNRLLDYWPKTLLAGTRKWVADSITQLEITRLDGELDYVLGTDGNLTLTKLQGSADVEQAIVRPYKGLPLFDNISGKVSFTDKKIDVSFTEIYHPELKFDTEKSKVSVDFSPDNIVLTNKLVFQSTLAILFDIGGSFVSFFVDYQDILAGITGNADTDITIKLSLSDFFNHPLDITANASVDDVDLFVSGFNLKDGKGNISYVNDELTANLTAMSGESVAVIDWRDNFVKGKRRIKIGGHLSANQVMGDIYAPFAQDINGEIALNGEYSQDRGKVGTIKLDADMQDVTVAMQPLYISKAQGETGSITAEAKIQLDNTVLFDRIALDFAGLNAQGTLLVDDEARAFIDMKELSWGRTRFKLEGVVETNGDTFFLIDGESFDLSGLRKGDDINWLLDRLGEDTGGEPASGVIALEGGIEKVYFVPDNNDIYARNMLYNIALDQDTTDMYMGMTYGDEQQNFTISFQNNTKTQEGDLRLDISSLTAFAETLSDKQDQSFAGERLKLTSQRSAGELFYSGRLETGNLTIYGVPVIGTILEAISLVTLNVSVLQKGYQTQGFFMDFDYDNQRRVIIKNMRLYSLAQGVTGTGVIDIENSTLDIKGAVIPLYTLSLVLGKTPILGPLLIGGEQDGLFGVGYKVRGDMADPDISVNPLESILPGFIKNLRNTLTTSPSEEALLENAAKSEGENE